VLPEVAVVGGALLPAMRRVGGAVGVEQDAGGRPAPPSPGPDWP